jgi:hypothetical protein
VEGGSAEKTTLGSNKVMLDAWEITIMAKRPQNETEGLERNQMLDEKVFQLKAELRKVTKGDLPKMILNQKKKIAYWAGYVLFFWSTNTFFFLCLRNPGTGLPGGKAKGRFRSRGPK